MNFASKMILVLLLMPMACLPSGLPDQSAEPDSVHSLDSADLKDLISHRSGKLLFLNFWATWCVPCIEELPAIARIAETYGAKGVEVIGVSVDDRNDLKTKVVPFLAKHQIPYAVYIASYDDQEKFINAVDSAWSGAVPATLIYDAHGKLCYFKLGEGDYGLFEKEILRILGSPSN